MNRTPSFASTRRRLAGGGRTFRVQSAQPPFGRPFLGRFVDIRPACTERGRCRLEHPDREYTTSANAIRPPADAAEHGTDGHKIADFIDVDPVRGHKIDRNEPEHPANAAERSANAVSTPADGPEHDAQCAKIADFIDADPACGHQTERNAVERSTNAVSPLADAGEHADRGRKRHDSAPEHPANAVSTPADECPDPAYDPDAGQRLLDTAAHRRAVRAEREACCGALRHLAHCCVAF